VDKHYQPKFQEEYSAKIPALTLLSSLGWSFLSPKQIMDYRDYKQDEVKLYVLTDILKMNEDL
jgi:type I restriction enzyme, R subunit